MRICHFTNTFLPHVGGVARAVQTLLEDQRRGRHRVLVVAPEFADGPASADIERHVARVPALTRFNDSDFSVRLPFGAARSESLSAFEPDLIHAHHPFLLGDTALRIAASRQVPVVFTHHTLYERYTHYLPVESEALGEFAAEIATRFANRCAAVIAPSESIRDLIVSRGVTVPVHAIPTGIDNRRLASGRGDRARRSFGVPRGVPLIGHLGRLAAEKNLGFLAEAISGALLATPSARALIVGDGPARDEMEKIFADRGMTERVVFAGKLTGLPLHDACAAFDVFAFSSTSETQGLVLAEAMAAGSPVVALDASGVREVVRDGVNGRLLPPDTPAAEFGRALTAALANADTLETWAAAARATALELDRAKTSARLLAVYRELVDARRAETRTTSKLVQKLKPVVERLATEGAIIADKTGALLTAVTAPATAPVAADNASDSAAPNDAAPVTGHRDTRAHKPPIAQPA